MKADRAGILASVNRFWNPGEVVGGEDTLDSLVSEGELVKESGVLYWRGKKTRYGMARPSREKVLDYILPRKWAYTGYSASRAFLATTQVPAKVHVAVPVLPEHGIDGVEFHATERMAHRIEAGLTTLEMSLLEALQEFDLYSEYSFDEVLPVFRHTLNTMMDREKLASLISFEDEKLITVLG